MSDNDVKVVKYLFWLLVVIMLAIGITEGIKGYYEHQEKMLTTQLLAGR